MPQSIYTLASGEGGVWSEKLSARVDQPKYKSALRQCTNLIPYVQGPLTRRAGTQFVAGAKFENSSHIQDNAVRLIPFRFSPQTAFQLEFGNQYIRFYTGGANPTQLSINVAPLWLSGTTYAPGSYATDANLLIYYTATGVVNSTVTPSADSTHWVQQTILEVPTPYSAVISNGKTWATDIWELKWNQSNDVIYFVHPDYPPYSLTRFSDTDWIMKQVAFLTPALLDQNATDTTISPSALTGSVTLTATAPAWVTGNYYSINNTVLEGGVIYKCVIAHNSGTFATDLANNDWVVVTIFNSEQIGGTWQLAALRASSYIEIDGNSAAGFSDSTSPAIQALGSWEVHTYGVWSSDIAIQRSTDDGQTWSTVRSVTGRSDRNVDLSGTSVTLAQFRIVITNSQVLVSPGATNPRVVFEVVDAFLYGLVQITAVASAYSATATVITQLSDPNNLQPVWISGNSYTTSNQVSYNFVNYTCSSNTSGTTPPPQDGAHWALTAPGATEFWSEAAWSDFRGYPAAITSFQQRMIYGGSGFEPQRIWGTVTNDLENFALGDQTLATDSFAFDLNAPGRGPIYWLIAQNDLFVGFSGAEWIVNSGSSSTSGLSSGAAITAQAINAVQQSTWGSASGVSPLIVGDAVIFCQRQATAIRQMLFSIYTAKYMSQNVTTLADHLFSAGIVQMDYQAQWHNQGILWTITQQGTLCGMSYELGQAVFGWHVHTTGANCVDSNDNALEPDKGFESVSVIDGNGTQDDEVWVVTNRTFGAFQKRYIERINPNNWETTFLTAPIAPAPVLADAFYIDCGLTVTRPGTNVVTGLDFLDGRWVNGLYDGTPWGPIQVANNQVTIPGCPATVKTIQLGLMLPYAGQPMRIDTDAALGITQGQEKVITDNYVRVWNALGGQVANPANPATSPAPLIYPNNAMVTEPLDIRVPALANAFTNQDPQYVVQGNDGLPITIIGVFSKYALIGSK